MDPTASVAADINVSSLPPNSFSLVPGLTTATNTAMAPSAATTTLILLSNTQQVINLKLTNTNYLFWHMQMKSYLLCQWVFAFVDSLTPCPSPHDLSSMVFTASTTFNSSISQAFLTSKQQDQLILSALLSSLSVDVFHLVVDCPTSASAWSTLEHALASPSNSRIMQLHGSLQDLRQGDDIVTLYLQQAKGLFDELAAAGRLFVSLISTYMCFGDFVVNFMIWLRVCQLKLTLFRTLSSIVICLLMNSSIIARYHLFCLLHPCCPHLRSLP